MEDKPKDPGETDTTTPTREISGSTRRAFPTGMEKTSDTFASTKHEFA